MISNHTLALLVSPFLIMTANTWPHRLEAQELGSPAKSMEMQGSQMTKDHMVSPDLMIPGMDPANGRRLFASKGCVVCHSVNGVGGTDAAPLDAATMGGMINPFDFVASMWAGARPMIDLQDEELGGQVEFTGRELADIIGFVHNADEQKNFSEADIPPIIKAAIAKMQQGEGGEQEENKDGMSKMKPESGNSGN